MTYVKRILQFLSCQGQLNFKTTRCSLLQHCCLLKSLGRLLLPDPRRDYFLGREGEGGLVSHNSEEKTQHFFSGTN